MTAEGTTEQPAAQQPTKRMRLRYAGTCAVCGVAVAAREWAIYDRVAKTVTCMPCSEASAPAPAAPLMSSTPSMSSTPNTASTPSAPSAPSAPSESPHASAQVITPFAGVGGGSARREYERRKNARETRIRDKHPRIGGLILALTDEPQSTQAWATGAKGEEELAEGLNKLGGKGVYVLHDRRIPRTKANIDHIAVAASGVFVIDAKRYRNKRPILRVEGGLFRPRTERLLIGGRDGSKLVAGVHKQVNLVRGALGPTFEGHDVAVHGMLCFIDADWPLIGGSFSVDGVDVVWPRQAAKLLTQTGPLSDWVIRLLHHRLANSFPAA